MSNGDSLDGFVFPPFIPTAAARPPAPPAPAAPPASTQPSSADPQSAASRGTMPWDADTPVVREGAAGAAGAADDDDLPWLERPEPREAAPAAEAAPDEAFPDWLAWDDRDTDNARAEVADASPLQGLEDLVPADGLGGFAAAPQGVEWAEAAPAPADSADAADTAASIDAPAAEQAFDGPALPVSADPADSSEWSLDAPEAVEPPIPPVPAAEVTFDSPAAAAEAEPAFDVTLDDGALTFAAAEPAPHAYASGDEAPVAAEPDPFTAAAVHHSETDGPADAAASRSMTTSGAFTEVAARLDEIARTLRERPDDLLSGSESDPLALLVAGYVMGYGARR